jgi:hypothetical protein
MTKFHVMKTCEKVEVQFLSFLTSALDGDEWSGLRSGRFILWERDPGTYWIGGWLGRRTGLNAVAKRKIPCPCRESNPGHPASSLVVILTELHMEHINMPYKLKRNK